MPSSRYLAIQVEFNRKQDELVDLLSSNRTEQGDYAVSKEECERREKELDDLGVQLRSLQALEAMEERHSREAAERRQLVTPMRHADSRGGTTGASFSDQSLGQLFKNEYAKRPGKEFDQEFSFDVKAWLEPELKATMLTTAGWAPETRRVPRIAEKIAAPIEVLDLFPTENTDLATIAWMEETTSTSGITGEIAEAGPYPEATLIFTQRTSTVRKIGTSLPISDEQLADVAGLPNFVDGRMRYFVRKRLDSQVINGDGTGVNLRGILSTAGLQQQAKGADPIPDAVYKAFNKIRTLGQATPTAIIFHPDTWALVQLLRTADGIYIWGSPADQSIPRIWGVPVVLSTVLSAGSALAGDFTQAQIWMRLGAQVEVGYVGTQFTSGLQTIRGSLRAALGIFRIEAFCQISGL